MPPAVAEKLVRLMRQSRDAIAQDVRYAVRGLLLRRGFTAMVAVTLALGIGANAAMFGIVDRLLLRAPDHIEDPERLVQIHSQYLGSANIQSSQPYAVYKDMAQVAAFENVGVTTSSGVVTRSYYSLGRGPTAMRVAGAQVSPSFFQTLGVRALRGRFFLDDEAGEENPQKLAVLGHRFWRTRFGGRDDAIGQQLDLGADRFTIVGVAPAGFTGAELSDVDVWIPIAAADGLRFVKGPEWNTTRSSTWLNVYARLKRGVSVEQATAQATMAFRAGGATSVVAPSGSRSNPDSMAVVFGPVIPGKTLKRSGLAASGEVRVARLLGAVSFMVLLLACANVANLLLVRALNRRREIAVRLALGISRRRLVYQLFIEGLLLSALGALGALVVVHFGSGFIRRLLMADSAWSGSALDSRVLLFTATVALLTGLLTSLVPAVQVSSPALTSALKAGSRDGVGTRSRTRSVLLATQAALAVVLLAGAGLFVRSLQRVAELPFGVDIERVLVADIEHRSVGLSNAEAKALYLQFAERVRGVRGVTATAVSIAHSFGLGWGTRVLVSGRPLVPPGSGPGFSQYAVTPDYFAVMGVRLIAGRLFDDRDREGAALVALLNETAARRYWPSGDAIGQCVQVGADTMPCTTVVGIVSNSRRQQLMEDPIPQLYRPLIQLAPAITDGTVSFFGYTLLIRSAPRPAALVEPIRRAIQSTAASVPYANVRPLSVQFGRHTRSWTLGATMFSVFGALALVLAVVGLYSVVVFTMLQRLHEYAVRLALGATSWELVWLTIVRGTTPALIGVVFGGIVVIVAGKFVGAMLFQTSARDPMVLGTAAAVLFAAAVLASLIPGLRATRTDPMTALRAE